MIRLLFEAVGFVHKICAAEGDSFRKEGCWRGKKLKLTPPNRKTAIIARVAARTGLFFCALMFSTS